jgi:hypothetical protein
MKTIITTDPVIMLELALDIIDAECAKFETDLLAERGKPDPSQVFIDYLEGSAKALITFSQKLSLNDTRIVNSIINGHFAFLQNKKEVASA